MTKDVIVSALETAGLESSPEGFAIPEDREATCFVAASADVLPIARVVRVDLRDKYVALRTHRNEHLFFSYENIIGFRLLGAAPDKERLPGFGR
jgi:hypothetical protein